MDGGMILCELCDRPARWRVDVAGGRTARLCDAHRTVPPAIVEWTPFRPVERPGPEPLAAILTRIDRVHWARNTRRRGRFDPAR